MGHQETVRGANEIVSEGEESCDSGRVWGWGEMISEYDGLEDMSTTGDVAG